MAKHKVATRRQPNGQAARTYEDPAALVKSRRIRDRHMRDASSEFYGFPLGIMFVSGVITAEQFQAGKTWAAITWRYNHIKGFKLPSCKAVDWGGYQGERLSEDPSVEEIKMLTRMKDEIDREITLIDPGGIKLMTDLCLLDVETAYVNRTVGILKKLAEWRESKRAKRTG